MKKFAYGEHVVDKCNCPAKAAGLDIEDESNVSRGVRTAIWEYDTLSGCESPQMAGGTQSSNEAKHHWRLATGKVAEEYGVGSDEHEDALEVLRKVDW